VDLTLLLPRYRNSLTLVLLVAVCSPVASIAAQRPDSARVGVAARTPVDTIAAGDSVAPPITPRRAFLYSLLAPGYAQTILGRPTAAALFILTEALSTMMIIESSASLREARRIARDSVYVGVDAATGLPAARVASPFPRALVRARQAQFEDWLAVLLANHVFAGADAFVAAHLWDVPVRVTPSSESRSVSIVARWRW
jgi:hypothetical protein